MMRIAVTFALVLGMTGLAVAAPDPGFAGAGNPLATPGQSSLTRGYRMIDPGLTGIDDNGVALETSNTIYLNNCKPNGCTITPGNENAVNNRSAIIDRPGTVAAYVGSDAQWNQVVDCVKQTYAAFKVNIVTTRPTSGSYHMAVVGGRPTDVGFDNGILGVSPYTCGFIDGGISFSFANVVPNDIDELCWTVAQETAHSWGLDHKYDNKDAMTYLRSGPSRKTFQNTDGPCGEDGARACQCGGNTMNSFKEIMATFGPVGPATSPTLNITAPRNNDTVERQFPVRADISDDIGVGRAELWIDNVKIGTVTSPPYVWNAPASLQEGMHQVKVIAYDIADAKSEKSVTVTYGTPCTSPSDCTVTGDVCIDGRCAAGQGVDGGLGTECATGSDCVSGQCLTGDGSKYCVESCIPGNGGCPSGFGCLEYDGGAVCWQGYDDGSGGGCATGTPRQGAMLLGLLFAALCVGRRRRTS